MCVCVCVSGGHEPCKPLDKNLWVHSQFHCSSSRSTKTANRIHMGVSKNRGKTPKSSILIGCFIIYKPSILGYQYFWFNTHILYLIAK